ncbi:ACN9 family protein [Oesophagostomum dentatum]|uniref:Succinate dehydrogenase assembly factor 3 n=1 Tax=Oesophagostomum dentatum TaxID=61180 RepID=A0A0B1RW41_OESDE|nr:ACN9 family protein [Oesophagostomum dentatum]
MLSSIPKNSHGINNNARVLEKKLPSRLHYGLPAAARTMGDIYVKDEFRRHKNASPEHTAVFINEWTNYCVTLSKQLSAAGIAKGFIGKDLEPEKLDAFAEEQLRQLLDLKIEAERMAKGEVTEESADVVETKEADSNAKSL